MTKGNVLRNIQKRLPKDIYISDEAKFEFTDDEVISILSWIEYFNIHFSKHQFNKLPEISFPIISTRLKLDFGLYNQIDNIHPETGEYKIYISKISDKQNIPITKFIKMYF